MLSQYEIKKLNKINGAKFQLINKENEPFESALKLNNESTYISANNNGKPRINSGLSFLRKPKHSNSGRPIVNEKLFNSLGLDRDKFDATYNMLCTKWWDMVTHDTVGKRLVTSTLAKHLNEPITLAIITDDVECFKKHFDEEIGDIYCLEFCCLCGAKNIIKNVYIDNESKRKCFELSENAIPYAFSTGDNDFALSLTKDFSLSEDILNGILFYSNDLFILDKIENQKKTLKINFK